MYVHIWMGHHGSDTSKTCVATLALGSRPNVRTCKSAGQEGSLRVTSHVPKSVGDCEGMNLHTPKWAPTLGIGVQMDSWSFRKWL